MAPFPAAFWLEDFRIAVQCGWFALFGVALTMAFAALWRPRGTLFNAVARGFWAAAMLWLIVMWGAGATLEMMRRAAPLPAPQLLVVLAAFSVFLTAMIALVRGWFGPTGNEPLRGDRIALSLLVLTLAGWWLGGLAQGNALWNFAAQSAPNSRAPDGWALSLAGATLLGASHLAQVREGNRVRVKNPRPATWWIFLVTLTLALPLRNGAAASVFLVGAGVFLAKIWRARRDGPLFLRVNLGTRAILILLLAALPFVVSGPESTTWLKSVLENWNSPFYLAPFLILCGAIFVLCRTVRVPLRRAIAGQFSRRALLSATLAGTVAATLLFGPAGAIFWAFWPLAALFFDLLAPRDSSRTEFSTETAARFELASRSADSLSA